ncbi:RagB/SusD family nutrient uptake outer membrane protein [Saccharicrinis aurantiacus]|uniref:RagB/SusD family nutrient uptake outer membrane protein n=1 Tax=Saccharicrinis aurantiacus TaxID=1849719 RepID=UPI0024924E5F|nr:RagB/SusD family nutrient uptake outer membrane protein [Saccharicrinis aurantiacus]
MKKILLNIMIVAIGIFTFSCSDDLLNTKPLDKYTEDDIWNDANLAQGFVYNIYQSVIPELLVNTSDPDEKMAGVGNEDFSDNVLTQKAHNVALDNIDKFYDAGWATNNSYYWYGGAPLSLKNPIKENSFEVIRDCNLVIENVAASEGIEAVSKPKLIAQGKMLRALIYYTKARMFGKYVIVDRVLTEEDDLKMSRSATIKETYDFIIKDLQEAAPDLPIAAEAAKGELTQGAAYAMLAEIALQGAAYVESGKEEYIDISKAASESLFALSYALDADYAGIFNNYEVAQNSSELILTRFRHIDATYCVLTPMQGLVPNMEVAKTTGEPKLKESFLGWTKCWPTHDLVEDYLVVDADGMAKKWNETSYYQNWETNGGFLSEAIYNVPRDARFEASVVRDSTQLFSNTITMRLEGNMHPSSSQKGTNLSTRTGYFVRKGIYDVEGFKAKVYTDYHQNIARLGRSYLNYAEAMLLKKDFPKAVEYINKTRVEHGKLPPLVSSDETEIWEAYKRERRVELFFENDRYWSLLRWGKFEGESVISELNDKEYKFFEINEDGTNYEIKPVFINANVHKKRFSERRYLFPVPEGERILNDKYDQNPLW